MEWFVVLCELGPVFVCKLLCASRV